MSGQATCAAWACLLKQPVMVVKGVLIVGALMSPTDGQRQSRLPCQLPLVKEHPTGQLLGKKAGVWAQA